MDIGGIEVESVEGKDELKKADGDGEEEDETYELDTDDDDNEGGKKPGVPLSTPNTGTAAN